MRPPPKSPHRDAVLPSAVEDAFADNLAPRLPAEPGRATALRERVLGRARAERPRFLTVRAADGEWQPLSPAVAVKILDDDGAMQSFLLRLDPGARLPAHEHRASDELCIVLEGSATLGDIEVSAGDYHVAFAGSAHGEVVSRDGALLFLRTASGSIPHRGAAAR
jgi:quercetin dioxygenase-like cupin family protein